MRVTITAVGCAFQRLTFQLNRELNRFVASGDLLQDGASLLVELRADIDQRLDRLRKAGG